MMTVEKKTIFYKIFVSILFGLAGFFLNFQTIIFPFGEYRPAILLGLLFPLIIALCWGWRYGLLSALAGGCQSMWWLWGPSNGYAIFMVVPPFTFWVVWHGLFAELRRKQSSYKWWLNPYVVEVPFRFLSSINLLFLTRWAVSINPPPWDWGANAVATFNMNFSVFVVLKQAFVAFMLLLLADVLLHLSPVRKFFMLRSLQDTKKTSYIISASLLFGCFYWIIDSFFYVFLFHKDSSFIDLFVRDIPKQIFFTRFVVFIFCLIFGLFAAKILRKQKEDEAALMVSEETLNLIFNTSPVGICTVDQLGNFVTTNPAYEQMLGYSKEELSELSFFDVTHPNNRPKNKKLFQDMFSLKTTSFFIEKKYIRKDGAMIDVAVHAVGVSDAEGNIIFGTAFVDDITERKQAEEAIEKTTRLLKTAENLAHIGSWEWDIVENKFFMSDEWLQIHGVKNKNLTMEELMLIGHPDDAKAIEKNFKDAIDGVRSYDLIHRIIRQDNGKERVVKAHGVVSFDPKGKPYKMIGTAQDITEKKQIEEELEKYREDLEEMVAERTAEIIQINEQLMVEIDERKHADDKIIKLNTELEHNIVKLEASNKELGAFSYSVSHDLRAPLRAIDGFSKILLNSSSAVLDDTAKRHLNIIRNSTQDMGKLIDDLLSFSRLGKQEISIALINMEQLAKDVFAGLKAQNPDRNIVFKIESPPPAQGDNAMIKIVLTNLLMNAIKFTGLKEKAVIEFGGSKENNEVTYYIRDNGVGFDMNYVNKLFGVFQRLHGKNEFEGTGIGLSLVQRIIHRHGGRVWAEGKVDEGASFYFVLPVKDVM